MRTSTTLLSPDTYPEQFLLTGMFVWLMAWRALERRGFGTDPRALAGLAVVSALFTTLFEPLWVWAIHGYEPMDTLRNDLTLDLGVPPPWMILALGLLIAAVAFASRSVPPRADEAAARVGLKDRVRMSRPSSDLPSLAHTVLLAS